MKTTIVIPTYNEANNIETLVTHIMGIYPSVHFIIVDDNSPDGTGEIADGLAERYPTVNVLHRQMKVGLGKAYVAGFKRALAEGADLIFEMDADFSHHPYYIGSFFEAIEGADLIIGSRYLDGVRVEGWRFRRLLLSKLGNIYASYIMVRPIWDFTSGFRCYRREVLEAIDLDKVKSDGYAFQIEMTYLAFKHGFRVREIPIMFRERKHGYSKISRDVVFEAIWMIWRCRAPVPRIIRHLSVLL